MSAEGGRLPAVLRRPEEGWSSLFLLLGMLVMVGVSIADARPLALAEDGESATGAFVALMVAAGLIGTVLARSSLGLVRAHVIGAGVGALLILLVASAALVAGADPIPPDLEALSTRVDEVWARLDHDVTAYVSESARTPTMATFLVLGAICWTTAQFSAFSIFRHVRAGPAVMATGAVLFLNIALGSLQPEADLLPVLPVLALYTSLAMLLLMRLQLVQQRDQWARRHISDAGEVSRLFLRSGVLFVIVTVISASSLTVWASVDAQDVDLGDLQGPVGDVGAELSRWLGLVGVPPPEVEITTIEDSWQVQSVWEQPNGVAFRAEVEGNLRGNYWWGWAHDRFDGRGWDRDKLRSIEVRADEPLPVQEAASAGGPHALRATITIGRVPLARGMAFRPTEAAAFDREVTAHVVDDGGGLGDISFDDTLERRDKVVVDAWVRDYRPDATSLTANRLRAAGDSYPAWLDRYLQGGRDPGVAGDLAMDEADEIATLWEDPYDRALEVQQRLQEMRYQTDMTGVCNDDETIPDCVLRAERGFCQHYSTTMAMVLRGMGIPSRLVTGYLQGTPQDGEWVVEQAAFHNWVEAYFPGHGWVRFDPTPPSRGFGQAATDFPEGELLPDGGGDLPLPTSAPDDLEPLETLAPSDEVLLPPPGADGGDGPLAGLLLGGGLIVLMSVLVAVVLLTRLRRLPDGDGGLAYRGIVDLATRLGHGPHPSQTEYEYAGTLSETIPQVRDELYLVTEARVETAYGQRQLEVARRDPLRRAYARIRTALLRLSLHRRR